MNNRSSVIFGVLSIVLVIIAIIFMFVSPEKKEKDIVKFQDYNAYIDIGTKFKFDFKIKCVNSKCEDPIVIDYEVIDEVNKDQYLEYNIDNYELNRAIEELVNFANKKNIDFSEISVFTNWNNFSKYINTIEVLDKKINIIKENDFFKEKVVEEEIEELTTTTTRRITTSRKTTTTTKKSTTKRQETETAKTNKKTEKVTEETTTIPVTEEVNNSENN